LPRIQRINQIVFSIIFIVTILSLNLKVKHNDPSLQHNTNLSVYFMDDSVFIKEEASGGIVN